MEGDYRSSHTNRGGKYDASLATDKFDAYMTFWEARHATAMLREVLPQGVDRYLDFACGTGRLTQVIAPLAREVVGVDVSETMLAAAGPKLPHARFVKADLTREDINIGQFDLVSSFRFFGNADPPLRSAVLKELNRRIRPGGYLLVNNHRNPLALMNILAALQGQSIDVDLTHRRFCRLLRDAGFEPVLVCPIAVWQFRHALAASAGQRTDREAQLERRFGNAAWAHIAPDSVILARKPESTE